MIGEPVGPWLVAEPQLLRRSRALLRAVERCGESVEIAENIHELRVASRRLEAAFQAFGGLISSEPLCRVRKLVRRIRRGAGRVRDLDVLILRLEQKSRAKKVIRPLRRQRRRLAGELTTFLCDGDQNQLRLDLEELTRERPAEPAGDPGQWAAEQMRPVADQFLAAARNDLRGIRNLHRLRLCGKRLRYSLELFRDELDSDKVSCLLNSLRGVQERLGDMNDHASARRLLRDIAASAEQRSVHDVAGRLAKREKRKLKRDRRRFLKWWRNGTADSMKRCIQDTVHADAAVASAQEQ